MPPPDPRPPPVIFEPTRKHTHTFVLLHGRGDQARAFGPQFMISQNSSGLPLAKLYPGLKFIFPCAQRRRMGDSRIEINMWFDIQSLDNTAMGEERQIEGLADTTKTIHEMIH
jgi:predicted esterase